MKITHIQKAHLYHTFIFCLVESFISLKLYEEPSLDGREKMEVLCLGQGLEMWGMPSKSVLLHFWELEVLRQLDRQAWFVLWNIMSPGINLFLTCRPHVFASRLCAYRALRTTRNPLPTHQRLQFKHWCWNGYSGLILENSGQSICMTFKFNPSFGALGSSFRLWLALIFWLWRARWERNKQGD